MLLILDRPVLSLRYERAALLVYEEGVRKRSVPAKQLERVVVGPQLALDAGEQALVLRVLERLLEATVLDLPSVEGIGWQLGLLTRMG